MGAMPFLNTRLAATGLCAFLSTVAVSVTTAAGLTATDRKLLVQGVEARAGDANTAALQIWEWAEVGYQETQSSALLAKQLRDAGFKVEIGVAGIPTAFVATAGSGGPVIGMLAEFDALPGITQAALAQRSPVEGKDSAHACGHHLFGAGSVSAAIAVKQWLEEKKVPGTIRLYGTPAEEGGAGKVYMVRAGLFDDVDVVLHWHAGDRNDASQNASNSNKSAKFRFHGISSHAAGAPEKGRSALDGVEAMNYMANLMREHMPMEARMHYVITRGGAAPNVVPDFAEVFYYVRHPDPRIVQELYARLEKAAEGAAIGTGTTYDAEVIHGSFPLLPNHTLGHALDANLREVGGVAYTPEEAAFAKEVFATLDKPRRKLGSEAQIQAYATEQQFGSTDVGDVSWAVPTVGLYAATWVPGTPSHSWQAAAAGGTSIGLKGMDVAARTLALTAGQLFRDPALIREARAEFEKARGPDFQYTPLLGDRPPPLDYRN